MTFSHNFLKSWLLLPALFLLLYLFFIHTHGFPTQDEGWLLQAAARFVAGEVPYRDLQFIYHPGSLYLNALGFNLFGVSVYASRLMALLNSVVAIAALVALFRFWRLPLPIASMALLSFVFWGPTHINFVWPVMLCLTTGIWVGLGWTMAEDLSRSHRTTKYWLFMVGLSMALTILLKQNFGVAILMTNLAFIVVSGRYRYIRHLWPAAVGLGLPLLWQLGYWFQTNSLTAFSADMKYLLFEKVISQGVLNSAYPWTYPGPVVYQGLKLGFYLLPALIGLLGLGVVWYQKRLQLAYFPLFLLSYYALSIRPTTDSVHLAPLLALSAVTIGLLYLTANSKSKKILMSLSLLFLMILGGYRGLISNYYRWDMPLLQQSYYLADTTAKVWVNPGVALQLQELKRIVDVEYPQEKSIFVYSYSPYLYLWLNRTNPTRYDYLHSGVLSQKIETEIIETLTQTNLQLVIANTNLATDPSQIAAFILANYTEQQKIGDYTLWHRR